VVEKTDLVLQKVPEGVGESVEVAEAEREGKGVESGEKRVWEWEKERWEVEVCNWVESGGGDARSSDAMAEDNWRDKVRRGGKWCTVRG